MTAAPETTVSAQFLGLLARDLPPDRLTTDPDVLAAHATDRSGTAPGGEPLAVVHARRTEDVTVTLRHAHALGVPVVPRGAGTGLSGGATAGDGVLVLDLPRMNSILDLSADDQLAVVEPGVITAELDRATATIAAYFTSFEAAAEACYALTRAGVEPALAELVDVPVLHAVDPALRERGAALLVVQCDGPGAVAAVARLLAPLASTVEVTEDPAEAEALLSARRLALPALERLGRPLIEDIAVPVFTIAHAADGNLHPIIVVDRSLDRLPDAAWEAAGEIFALALRLGGTLTGEHGVGVLKRQWVAEKLGPAEHALQRRIKEVFDPRGILNPGKAL
ncbi:FAD-binding oxidoreductase [Streptomyces sp. NPDC003015]